MKINIIGVNPLYVSEERAASILKAIEQGVEIIEIDGHYIKPSAISSITPEEEPREARLARKGMSLNHYVPTKRLPEPKGDGKGYERYVQMRNKMKI